jgi:hypothetical protein
MQIKKLMIKKEEIPILYDRCFQAPIHPRLLDSDVKVDENIARKVFPRAAKEWHAELTEYSKILEEENIKRWIEEVFLKRKPKIKKEYDYQVVDTLYWKDDVFTNENGFAYSLMISRNSGGTLYFDKNNFNCKTFAPFDASAGYIRFSKEKCLEFGIENKDIRLGSGVEGVKVNVYDLHNVDYYPGALFLRNWVLLYLNEAMKQVIK